MFCMFLIDTYWKNGRTNGFLLIYAGVSTLKHAGLIDVLPQAIQRLSGLNQRMGG